MTRQSNLTIVGGIPTIPDPNTSAKVLRYKWEAYRDTHWWCIDDFLPRGGHTFAKYRDRIAILFKVPGSGVGLILLK